MDIEMSSSNASQSGCYWLGPDEITLVQQEYDELHYQIYSFWDLVGSESGPIMDDLFTQLSQAQDGVGDLHAAVRIRERGDALGLQDAELQCTSEYQTFNGIKNQLKELKTNFDTISKSRIDNPALKDALEALTPERRKAVHFRSTHFASRIATSRRMFILRTHPTSRNKNKSSNFVLPRTMWNKTWWKPRRKSRKEAGNSRAYDRLARTRGSNMPRTKRHGRSKRPSWSAPTETSSRQPLDASRKMWICGSRLSHWKHKSLTWNVSLLQPIPLLRYRMHPSCERRKLIWTIRSLGRSYNKKLRPWKATGIGRSERFAPWRILFGRL